MKEALNVEKLRYMQIRLYNVGSADGRNSDPSKGKQLLFDSDQLTKGSLAPSAIDASGTFVHTLPVEIASRIWEFQYSARKTQ